MNERVPDPSPEPMGQGGRSAGPSLPLSGRSGARTGADVLAAARTLAATGTLALSSRRGTLLIVLEGGEEKGRRALGADPELEVADQTFLFHAHPVHGGGGGEEDLEPILPSMLPQARQDALRAWPQLGTELALRPRPVDLSATLERLEARGFDGVLGGRAGSEEALTRGGAARGEAGLGGALVIVAGGRPVAAVAERDGHKLERGDALRALMRQAMDVAAPELWLAPLPEPLTAILAGMALGLEGDERDATTGAAREGHELVLLREGRVLLRLASDGRGDHVGMGLVRAARDVRRLRELPLPDDPPGFEDRRYRLTLRGRDVLDPMTDLSMRFEAEIGASGKRLLRTLQRGLPVARVGQELGLELDQLRPWLRRLEEDGLIQAVEA